MVSFTAELKRFNEMGEKTGWTYVDIPAEIAVLLKPDYKRSFRVKGKMDHYALKAVALIPMGEGDYIFAVNGEMRKKIKKQKGDTVELHIEEDTELQRLSSDFTACLEEDKTAKAFFETLPSSHQHYFSRWIESAKTEETKAKRIAMSINGLGHHLKYNEMIRASQQKNKELGL